MFSNRRKETEKAAAKGAAKKRKAAPAKKSAKKTKTAGDEELAKNLAGRRESARDRDKKGTKSKKLAALAALKKERKLQQQQQRDESSDESELDFGEDDDDSDEDYDEDGGFKPWQKKTRSKSTVSRLDKDDGSGEDMDIDEDVAPQKKDRSSEAKESAAAAEAGLEDFKKCTIPRRRLARWCNEPFFEAAVLECFVRLFIGEDEEGEKVYRLCEITEVTTSNKSYKFPVAKKTDKVISTNKSLRLKFGNSERPFPMYLVSDTPPEELDVQKYITTQKNNRLPVLTKRRATKLRRLQDDLVNNYTYTTEDIERNLERRKKQGKSAANLGLEQTKVLIALEAAKENVNDMERRVTDAKRALMEADSNADEGELTKQVREAEKLLDNAKKQLEKRLDEQQATEVAVKDRKRKLTQRAKDRNWARVNERNVQINQRADREAKDKDEAVSGSGKKKEFNPYARRKVKPKILWEVGQAKEEEEEANAEEKKDGTADATQSEKNNATEAGAPVLVQEPQGKAAALRDRHQFAIDEEGLAQSTAIDSILGGTRKKAPKKARVRKGISLTEYLERKENGTL